MEISAPESDLVHEVYTRQQLDDLPPNYLLYRQLKVDMYRAWWDQDAAFHFVYRRRPRTTRPRTKLNRRASRRKA